MTVRTTRASQRFTVKLWLGGNDHVFWFEDEQAVDDFRNRVSAYQLGLVRLDGPAGALDIRPSSVEAMMVIGRPR